MTSYHIDTQLVEIFALSGLGDQDSNSPEKVLKFTPRLGLFKLLQQHDIYFRALRFDCFFKVYHIGICFPANGLNDFPLSACHGDPFFIVKR